MKKKRNPKPIIIGLTGGIGMGKSTAARILSHMGLSVHNADHAVHALLRKNGKAVKPIAKLFPGSVGNGTVRRKRLGRMVFGNPKKLKQLENILHPLVFEAEEEFLQQAIRKKAKAVVLDIPLLFETGGQKRCDFVVVVSAPKAVQKARVLRRKGMTLTKFKAILKHQMSDGQKRKLADYVVRTGKNLNDTKAQLKRILAMHRLV